jgi:predicted DNA-binding protein
VSLHHDILISRSEEVEAQMNTKVTTVGGTERKTIPVRLPADMHQELKLLALFTGRSVNDIITELVSAHLAGPGREEIEHGMTARAATTYKEALDKLAEM